MKVEIIYVPKDKSHSWKNKAHIGKVCPTILVLALLTYLYVPLNSMMADLALKVPQINWMLYFQELVHPMTMTEDEGAKYLVFSRLVL